MIMSQRNKPGRSVEVPSKMAIFANRKITDKERLRDKNIVSPDLSQMPIRAINPKLRSITYFHNSTQFRKWSQTIENLQDYKIHINKNLLGNGKAKDRIAKRA